MASLKQGGWQTIVPDDNHDWLNQVDPDFDRFIALGEKKDKTVTPMFKNFSSGCSYWARYLVLQRL